MKTYLWLLCFALALSASPLFAGEISSASQKSATKSHLSLLQCPNGKTVLSINYPWKTHKEPSVELVITTNKDFHLKKAHPLFFHDMYFHAGMMVEVYRVQDASDNVSLTKHATKDNIDFEIFGYRNFINEPSACVVYPVKRESQVVGTGAVFCLLDSWAIDKTHLCFDLPEDHFKEPGKMRVWFLRKGRTLWSETIEWPGKGKNRAKAKGK